jgi:opacity protein-like surface antigen
MSQLYNRSLVFVFLFISVASFAQKRSDVGIFAGTSYYLGDINPSRQFYSPSFAVGGLFRQSLNRREVLRANLFYGSVKGNDKDFSNLYQQSRGKIFSASMVDASLLFEFNFFPVVFQPRKTTFSPYTFAGLGYEIILSSSNNTKSHFSVPFGTGLKYVVNEKLTMGVEWSFRKTFMDGIDGVTNPGEEKYQSAINNKDWYSFAGIFITFRLFDKTGNCPVYQKK